MDNIPTRNGLPSTSREGQRRRSISSQAHRYQSNTVTARYSSYNARPMDSSSNHYLSVNQGATGGINRPDHAFYTASGFQRSQAVRTYQGTIDGQTHTFTSPGALLRDQRFIDNFKVCAQAYLPNIDIHLEEDELKKLVLENEYIQSVFFLVNKVETINLSASAVQRPLTEHASANGLDTNPLPTHSPEQQRDRRRRVSLENHQSNLVSGGRQSPEQAALPTPPSNHSNPVIAVNSSALYSCHVNGEHKNFGSTEELLAEHKLLQNFRNCAELYNITSDIPVNEADLKNFIKSSQERLNTFILMNDVKLLPTAGHSGNYAEASEVRPISVIYNRRMGNYEERRFSLTLHGAHKEAEFMKSFPVHNKSTFKVSEAGFYLSLKERKLACFSCGGSIEQWHEEWGNITLDELHARLYPKCTYLRQRMGMEFIEARQQQLTPEQRHRLAQPLEGHPHLYCLPVTDSQWQQERVARDNLKVRRDIAEDRLRVDQLPAGVINEQNHRALTRHANQGRQIPQQSGTTPTIASNINRILREFHSSFLTASPLHRAMDRLHDKVTAARDVNNQLNSGLLQILQSLMALPEDQWADTGAEITEIINAAYDHDCQDHTSEIIDQIKTRMAFINIKQELEAGTDVIEIATLLKKLKLFYNESVLYKVMATTRMRDGTPLVAARESTEIRGYIKNQFSRTICQFPENHVLQRYGDIGRQLPEIMAELESKFIRGIRNKADFHSYIIDMFRTEPELLNLLRVRNAEFAIWHGKTESNAELLMDQYSPDMPRLSEQEIIEGAANVVESRNRFMNEDLDQFISQKLDLFWDDIIQDTSR